jgi:integrase/recombinase XerC
MSMLSTLLVLARQLEMIDWTCDIRGITGVIAPSRDCRGPDRKSWLKFWAHLMKRGDTPVAVRDRAMYAVMFDCALRVGETVALELEDLDLGNAQISIKGKGRHGTKEWRTIAPRDVELCRQWIAIRGDLPGALFCSHPERCCKVSPALFLRMKALQEQGLTAEAIAELLNAEGFRRPSGERWNGRRVAQKLQDGATLLRHIPERRVWYALQALSREAGLDRMIRPHGIRHASITRALDLTDGNVRDVQKFSRHASVITTMRYDDRRTNISGQITRMLADHDHEGAEDAGDVVE